MHKQPVPSCRCLSPIKHSSTRLILLLLTIHAEDLFEFYLS